MNIASFPANAIFLAGNSLVGNNTGSTGPCSAIASNSFVGSFAPTLQTSTYNANAGDAVLCDVTSGSLTVNLPNAPADKSRVLIKLVAQGGTYSPNSVTYACQGSDVLNIAGGPTSGTLQLLNQAVQLLYNASSQIWYIISDDMPLGRLDIRFGHEFDGWSIVGNAMINPNTAPGTTVNMITSRLEFVSPWNLDAIALVYSNWYPLTTGSIVNGETPSGNIILIQSAYQQLNAALSATGSSVNDSSTTPNIPFTFGGTKELSIIGRGSYTTTSPLRIPVPANTRNYFKTTAFCPLNAIPAAPTAAASSGSGITAGTYVVGYTIVYPDGWETVGSTGTSVTTSGGNLQITITAPAAASWPGAIGWRAWKSLSGATTPLYATAGGIAPLGTNIVLSGSASTSISYAEQRVLNGIAPGIVRGPGTTGGTGVGSTNNGEYSYNNADAMMEGTWFSNPNTSVGYGPICVLGLDPQGVHQSLAIVGDSIAYGTGDYGFANSGRSGWPARMAQNQQSNRKYSPSTAPYCGYVPVACAGETAATFSGIAGKQRSKLASLATTILIEYGTNDLGSNASTCTQLIGFLQTIVNRFNYQGKPRNIALSTVLPRTASSDFWVTTTNQSGPLSPTTATFEPNRRQHNSWLRATTGSQTITSENMYVCYSSWTSSSNWTAGGNGSITTFVTGLPFATGTETIKVNGVTKVLTTDYTYSGSVTINGTTYASGVVFVSAPGNGLSVTASYTSMPSLTAIMGSNVVCWDAAAAVEVNASNVLTANGGFWYANSTAAVVTGTSSGSNTASTFNDTSKTWTQDQYANFAVGITGGTGSGQLQVIEFNSATQLTVPAWSPTPDATSTYKIFQPWTQDGTHPTADGHMAIAQGLSTSLIK